jgi:phosphatidylinositol alpha-1,6-mannosyltransferase
MAEHGARRVLLVSRNMPPLVGGMERLNWHIAAELNRRLELQVVAPRGSAALAPAGVLTREVAPKPLGAFLALSMVAAIRAARAFRPDVVLAGSGLMAPVAELAARLVGAKAVAYVHGLDVAVENAIYEAFWLPSIRRMDRVVANSRFSARLCARAGVSSEVIGIVHPGVAARAMLPETLDRARAFRDSHGLGDGPCLLSIGRLTARKGLREFVCEVLPMIAARYPEVRLVVVGGEAIDALHSESHSMAELRKMATRAGVERNLSVVGRIPDDELEHAWAASAAHVFPVREIRGDPEGFGMVALEAASHGVPTIAYAVGGVPDAVHDGVSGTLVEPGDAAGFANAVDLALTGRFVRQSVMEWADHFDWHRFGDALEDQLSIAISGGRDGTGR